jgi:Family of unknown function (DUF5685)
MYGLMRARHCGQSVEQGERHRFHYCGTCKTLGRLYGQRSRLLLNHDAVFLAELLTLLSAESPPRNADKAYLSYNCLSLPRSEDGMPRALQLAAAANILLTEFKVADRIKDGGLVRWRLVQRFFSGGFRRATAMLRRSGFPVDELRRLQDRQDEREAKPVSPRRSPAAALRRLASPTAAATAMFFAHGARAVGRPEAPEVADAMRRLGYDFGRLVYFLDAFEDYEEDWRRGEFNALRAAFGWTTESLTAEQRRQVMEGLLELRRRIVNRISTLPIPVSYARLFSERLDYNLSRRFGKSLPVLNIEAQFCRKRELTLSARWKNAVSFAKRMMSQEGGVCSKGAWLRTHVAFVSALAIVFLFPSAASRLRTWQDCWSLGLNLMFLSALPGAVLAVVTSITDPAMNDRKKRNAIERASDCVDSCRDNCRDCCGDCCADCCGDCCGEGCKCGCEECCSHCNCCDGCCDGCGCDCN